MRVPGVAIALGFVSFLTDASSEMIFPLVPLFLSAVLGAGPAFIGIVEGIAQAAASLSAVFAGWYSDRMRRYKAFALAGYGLSAVTKAGLVFASAWYHVLAVRSIERVGKGIRGAPRDVIIANATPKRMRGTVFGLHRTMDTTGAVAGPLAAFALLSAFGSGEASFRLVFGIAIVPALLAVALLWLFVREPKIRIERKRLSIRESIGNMSPEFRRFAAISLLFSLGLFSFAFLILRAYDIGVPIEQALLLYVLFNVIYALSALPAGLLADALGKKRLVATGFALYGLTSLGFAFAGNALHAALLFALYGVFMGIHDGVTKAYISDISARGMRGTAMGGYNALTGITALLASVVAGVLWQFFGAASAFGFAAATSFAASALLIAWRT
jgi:MFS family permease